MRKQNKTLRSKLIDYLENSVCFRDYTIHNESKFGTLKKIAVHQMVSSKSLEIDVDRAVNEFCKHGFSNIVFYIRGSK